jgi:hypothetical protein
MFKGTEKRRSNEDMNYHGIDIYPVLTAQALFLDEKRKVWLGQLADLIDIKATQYKLCCEPALRNFAEFVQNLPSTKHGLYYSHRGGVLDQGIERCINVMHSVRDFLPDESEESLIEEKKQLWQYAVFTASLLFDVGKVAVKTIVTLRERTRRLKTWNPFEGTMLNLSSHYSYDFSVENWDMLRRQVTPLLAKQLMPELGFNWLSSDKDVLTVWFALLQEDYRQLNAWMSIIPSVDAQMLDSYFDKYQKELVGRPNVDPQSVFKDPLQSLKNTEVPKSPLKIGGLFSSTEVIGGSKTPVTGTPFSTIGGEAFLQWLKNGIAAGSTSVNLPNSGVHIIGEGVLLLEKIFQDFVKENPVYGNWQEIKKQFEHLEITKQAATSEQHTFRHYASTSEFKLLTEVTIVTNMYVVFLHSQKMPGINPHIVQASLMQDTLPPSRPENAQVQRPSSQNNPQGT